MRIALVHNYYQYPGGEDTLFCNVRDLFLSKGHQVFEFNKSNDEIKHYNFARNLKLIVRTTYNRDIVPEFKRFIKSCNPDIVQFFNTFPLISPAAYYVCRGMGVPVVQSLDNSRLLCPSAMFYRKGRSCTDCLGKLLAWPGILHGCYKSSYAKTAVVAAMACIHRLFKTWENAVDTYIVATQYYRNIFIRGGLPAEKIIFKPHFVLLEGESSPRNPGNYALFIGRLCKEKGIFTLLKAWERLGSLPLKIAGKGPSLKEANSVILQKNLDSVEILGYLSREGLFGQIRQAKFLIFPSEGIHETFGLVSIEAFACGVPVIASDAGVATEIVDDGRTGLIFRQGDPDDLAAKVNWALSHEREMEEMGARARKEYEEKYTSEKNYQMFMEIYQNTIRKFKDRNNAKVS
jgi:glycosyltransferase involved in cell wall biosynthesis